MDTQTEQPKQTLAEAEAREQELFIAYNRVEKECVEKIVALRVEMRAASEAWGKALAEVIRIRAEQFQNHEN